MKYTIPLVRALDSIGSCVCTDGSQAEAWSGFTCYGGSGPTAFVVRERIPRIGQRVGLGMLRLVATVTLGQMWGKYALLAPVHRDHEGDNGVTHSR